MDSKYSPHNSSSKKRLPGIHWLMVFGIVLMVVGSLAVIRYIVYEIDNNTRQNEVLLGLSQHIELESQLVSQHLLPAFKLLHSLDITVSRHLAEFELYVLDADRGHESLTSSLSDMQSAFDRFPRDLHAATAIDRDELEEIVAVFGDITNEALDVRSPNQLQQLLSDSEDVFAEFQSSLADTKTRLDNTVLESSEHMTQDLRSAGANLSTQRRLLSRLERTSVGSLSLLVLLLLIVSALLFRVLQRRLGKVSDYARAIADGRYKSDIDFESSDHIGDVAESVSHMGTRLASLLEESQKKTEIAVHAERAALKLANFDTLTGLPNRQHFFSILESVLTQARQLEEKVAVAYLDLDDFKKVNDSFGHSIGDELLCAVADRLKHNIRESDSIARDTCDSPPPKLSRLGGDEFTFLITSVHDAGEARTVARRVLDTLARPYLIGTRELSITPSVGIAVFPNDGDSVEALLKNADMAMYQAKAHGRNNVTLYSEEIGERNRRKLNLERDLAKAAERGELSIHYQPKVDLNSNRIIGAEALLRWQHPKRGSVSPADFIPLAEESGLIVPIGKWVLQQVCTQLSDWATHGIAQVPIAVNISAKQLACGDLIGTVRDCLEASDITADSIQLELTESVLMSDTDLVVRMLNELKGMGIHTSLDDFGTGYSSLNYLKRFHLGALKIDRSFVRDIETDADDASIVKAIIGLADSLGLDVVAEGVENERQVDFLRRHGCRTAQGFLFSPAVPAVEFVSLFGSDGSERAALTL
ncbi:MAG: EAL domain-containing protein [Sedimenticolaceae bacterium]